MPEKGVNAGSLENRGTWVLMAIQEVMVFKDQMAPREHEGTMEKSDQLEFRVILDLREHRECLDCPENWECKGNLVVLDWKVPLGLRV